jgi:hypothetical protein
VTNNGVITAGETNTVGILTLTNLVMAGDSTYVWNYDSTTQDLINVTGTLTLPNVATVTVSKVASGTLPSPAVLFNFGTCPVADGTTLTEWVINGAGAGARAKVSGKQVLVQISGGMIIEIY